MSVTLLRKLTAKSTMKFGMHEDNTVGQLLDLKKYRYLRWVYFNCSNITFMDDILDEINLPIDFRINKPGVARDKHDELNSLYESKMLGITKLKSKSRGLKIAKSKMVRVKKLDNYQYCKGNLKGHNQGKYKS
jgi:hypothetical protein